LPDVSNEQRAGKSGGGKAVSTGEMQITIP